MLDDIKIECDDRYDQIIVCLNHCTIIEKNIADLNNNTLVNILKSSIVLMTYNLIEYVFQEIFDRIYNQLEMHDFNKLKFQIQEQISNHFYRYKKDCTDSHKQVWLISDLLNCTNLNQDINKLWYEQVAKKIHNKNISWNVNGKNIQIFLQKYHIDWLQCFNHNDNKALFDDIVNKRNMLAHWTASFEQCTKDITLVDLTKNCKQIKRLIDQLLGTLSDYLVNKKFLNLSENTQE